MMQPMYQQHQLSMPWPHGHPSMMMPPPPQMQSVMHVPPPPESQFAHLQVLQPYGQLPQLSMGMMHPPPHPEEPEPKRQKFDESALVPEDQFLAQHPVIEIIVQSLSENVGSLKEKIAGEMQIPANKQKLSGKAGFLKDNMSLAHYNVGSGEILTLSLRERAGFGATFCSVRYEDAASLVFHGLIIVEENVRFYADATPETRTPCLAVSAKFVSKHGLE
ncbi:Ubiquitin-like domain superfamily [Arabidopsis thaliana x Arabidopsis arenosa]|uniref:Ubiquitin-like domain superfamily n=1 Tax=Arabidopsis thaliana x Arabidopsis arenosa TaxID=1240361 RepID=A0A8T2CF41_9BRAS|nr:Ubiquitin-like domain superfamily [Arabidopsis thaliana x Arabidopsis arenosa]